MRGKIAVITGAAQGIGACMARAFRAEGAVVCGIDLQPMGSQVDFAYEGDIADEQVLRDFAKAVLARYGRVDFLINNAAPLMRGLENCSYEAFMYALQVGLAAPFYLTKLFAPYFPAGSAIVNISSSRDRMSQAQTESYTAAKGGISALTHALAVSLAGRVRVNSISPGWIDTSAEKAEGTEQSDASRRFEPEDLAQHPAGRIGRPEDIAAMAVFLCSERAGFITGENICIDGGMTRQMIYHNDCGWNFKIH